MGARLRVVTYNIHKCRGMDRRVRPERIVAVLKEINPDLIALQEVLSIDNDAHELDQARYVASAMRMECIIGENKRLHGGAYGNVTLSRWPIHYIENYDLSVRGAEPRGCLRTDIQLPDAGTIHLFNVHLGTSFMERRQQGRRLVDEALLNHPDLTGPRILVGDFNEWTRGLASRLLSAHLQSADIRTHLRRARTYPGLLPVVWHLDHVYHDGSLELERMSLHQSRLALMASDHLPLVADLHWRL